MRIERLELRLFRNYEYVMLEFPSTLNIFVGENAQGKTNLLEAIYVLAMGRSHRTSKEADLIGWGAESARVRADVERETSGLRIETLLKRDGPKETKVNGQAITRLTDLLGHVNVVLFAPDDLQLVKGAPGLRRRFLDLEIAQVSPAYRHHFSRYQRVFRQRNNLLKAVQGGQAPPDSLEVWDDQLIVDGARIVAKRARTIQRLSYWSRTMQEDISGGKEKLNLVYRPFFSPEATVTQSSWEDVSFVEREFRKALHAARKDEIYRGTTLVGPQRDDVAFLVDDIDLRYFGSQGQQRTAVLSCKLAEIEFMKEEVDEYPVLLLDDVMSELDDSRRTHFLRTITGRINTFITTTNTRSFTDDILEAASVYSIQSGQVRP